MLSYRAMWLQGQKPCVNTDDGTQASISIHIAVTFGAGALPYEMNPETYAVEACLHWSHYMSFTNNTMKRSQSNNDFFFFFGQILVLKLILVESPLHYCYSTGVTVEGSI